MVIRSRGRLSSPRDPVFVGGSGTAARFLISFAALASDGGITKITGDASLSKRPVQPLIDALASLGAECYSEHKDGKLPVLVRGGGLRGGKECEIDGSISSQFISSLLIACVKAQDGETLIKVTNPQKLVSAPYIDSTIGVLQHFGFKVRRIRSDRKNQLFFRVEGGQAGAPKTLTVPGDMSSGASLVCAAISAQGSVELLGVNSKLPQADSAILGMARKFGASVSFRRKESSVLIRSGRTYIRPMRLDLKESPDLVPVVAGLAAGTGRKLTITNVGHLRFKESDRLHTIARELQKLGVKTKETSSSLAILGEYQISRKPIVLESESDHRILMALVVAGLSGRFGAFSIRDPSCVKKSYPDFLSDIRRLAHDKAVLKILE